MTRRSLPSAVLPLFLAAAALAQSIAPVPSTAGVTVQRTFMPEAGPSSFAVDLGSGIGFCYDPGRGGINYIWNGDPADLSPTWRGKINKPAELRGEIVHRETARWPLRLGRPEREPAYEFKGYVLHPDGVEFHGLLDGVLVRELIRLAPDGRGLLRTFRLGQAPEAWWYLIDLGAAAALSSKEGRWDERFGALTGRGAREFTIRIQLP